MTDAPSDAAPDLGPGIDPEDLATTLRVLSELHQIDNEHPDFVVVLPWNLWDEVTTDLSYMRDWGGRCVRAVPELQVG